jgi:hypothetical protein
MARNRGTLLEYLLAVAFFVVWWLVELPTDGFLKTMLYAVACHYPAGGDDVVSVTAGTLAWSCTVPIRWAATFTLLGYLPVVRWLYPKQPLFVYWMIALLGVLLVDRACVLLRLFAISPYLWF